MIEVHNLTKRFGGTTAVDDLTFQVEPGVVTGFLGPNGAGKSTTMRMMVGLDRPSEGEALVDGVPYSRLTEPLNKVGCLLDATWVHRNRSASAHLKSIAVAGGIPPSRALECLDLVGLKDVAKKKVGGFSLGMRQRLGLAGAMLGDPEVLIFDEPVNGLDPEGILWVRRFMHSRAAEGRTVLVSSHLLSEMAQTAQNLVVIGRGKLRAQTSVEEFVSAAAPTFIRTPDPERFEEAARRQGFPARWEAGDGVFLIDGRTAAEVGELAAANNVVVHGLGERKVSLEEAFMALTESDVEYHAAEPDGVAAGAGAVGAGAAGAGAAGAVAAGAPGARRAEGAPGSSYGVGQRPPGGGPGDYGRHGGADVGGPRGARGGRPPRPRPNAPGLTLGSGLDYGYALGSRGGSDDLEGGLR